MVLVQRAVHLAECALPPCRNLVYAATRMDLGSQTCPPIVPVLLQAAVHLAESQNVYRDSDILSLVDQWREGLMEGQQVGRAGGGREGGRERGESPLVQWPCCRQVGVPPPLQSNEVLAHMNAPRIF